MNEVRGSEMGKLAMGEREMQQRTCSTLCAVLVLAYGLLACSDDPPPVCGAGTELVAGECLPTDEGGSGKPDGGGTGNAGSGAMCGGDTFEQGDSCEGVKPIGAACERGRECATGTCLPEAQGLPGGYCSVLDCNANRPCPAGSLCRYSGGAGHFVCLAFCDGDDDCRSDSYVCQSLILNELHVCAPSCTGRDICPNPTRCDEASGRCVIDQCDPASDEPCHADEKHVCYPDSRDLTESGGVCLIGCDPADAAVTCSPDEVCQPLPEEPEHTGFCSPPLCTQTSECPPGATCADNGACKPPARCDVDGQCADASTVCIGGAGGQCLPACPSGDSTCGDLHPGLACSDTLGACLPIGTFPGSPCRDERSNACDSLSVTGSGGASEQAPMVCIEDRCLLACDTGGEALCSGVSPVLTCADGIYDVPVCLPKGAFPGGPCGAGDTCAPLARGEQSLPMTCAQERCAVTCDASNGGAALCAGVDASLVCADDLFGDGVDLCLPYGSFPGGPCGSGNACATGMSCQDGRCLYECTTGGDALCTGVRATLTCAQDVYDVPVCLPKGSFPGGPCGTGSTCAPLQQGAQSLPTTCKDDRCLLTCDNTAGGDQLCAAVDGGLVCADNLYGDGVDLCLPRGTFPGGPCGAGNACDDGLVCKGSRCLYDCTTGGNTLCGTISAALACAPTVYDVPVCLPKGSFPGGACGAGNTCASDLGGLAAADMRCQSGVCVVQCASFAPFAASDALCGAVSSTLTCVDSAGPQAFCSLKCGAGNTCPTGMSCLTSQQACLPTGSFLGSPCASGACSPTAQPTLVCAPTGAPPAPSVCQARCNVGAGMDNAYCVGIGVGFTQCQMIAAGLEVCTP